MVLYSELDSKSDTVTPNWIGSPPCYACFLGSPTPSWCPTCTPWSTPWFQIIIKSLDSNIFSRSLVDEHKNEFTWWFSHCTHDLVIGPCTSIEGVVVSDVVMSSSKGVKKVELTEEGGAAVPQPNPVRGGEIWCSWSLKWCHRRRRELVQARSRRREMVQAHGQRNLGAGGGNWKRGDNGVLLCRCWAPVAAFKRFRCTREVVRRHDAPRRQSQQWAAHTRGNGRDTDKWPRMSFKFKKKVHSALNLIHSKNYLPKLEDL
jgi:hypothetical protein